MDSLIAWAASHGAHLHPSIEVYADPVTGSSLRVRPSCAPVPPGEPIVSVPHGLALSYLSARDRFPHAPPHVASRLLLIHEYLLGQASFWHAYIATLPPPSSALLLPPFWGKEERSLFEGTNLEAGISRVLGLIEDEKRFVPEEYRGLYPWAYCVFSTRSFRPSLVLPPEVLENLTVGADDFSLLLPLFDIANHDPTAEATWDVSPRDCVLRIDREHTPGEQVYNNYGGKTNAELLLGYGFTIPPSPDLHNDYVHLRKRSAEEYLLSLRPVGDPASLLVRRRQAVRANPVHALSHVQLDMPWDIFRTLAPLHKAQNQSNEKQNESGSEEEEEEEYAHEVLEGNVHQARDILAYTIGIIQDKVLQELEKLDSTDPHIDTSALSKNQILALQYRRSCRAVLENTLATMNDDF